MTPPEWRESDERASADLITTGIAKPFRKEYFRKDGSRVPVLVGAAIFKGGGNEGAAFVVDLSEQKRVEDERKHAEEALQKAEAELAHVSRVTTLGELSASIAHEINQPLTALVTDASACIRWMAAQNLEEARASASRVIAHGKRASGIIARIRALAKKAPPQKDWLYLNETIGEVLLIAGTEIRRHQVLLKTRLSQDLPRIMGDKIQLQQVILNLLMNAIEAMSTVDERQRELSLSSERTTDTSPKGMNGSSPLPRDEVLVTVRDSGPGFDHACLDRLFDAFYTTKSRGLGMGLAISRSIIEAHGGRLQAIPNSPRGATFQFILPISNPKIS